MTRHSTSAALSAGSKGKFKLMVHSFQKGDKSIIILSHRMTKYEKSFNPHY